MEFLEKNLENENSRALSAISSTKKRLLKEFNAVKRDEDSDYVNYGWRPYMLELFVRVSSKLEKYDNPYSSLLATSGYNSIVKSVTVMVTNNVLRTIVTQAHRDYLKDIHNGIR